MEMPSLAVGGVVPTVSPLLVLFLVMALAGGFLLVAALLIRNFRLVTQKRLNPFSLADIQRAADPTLSTRAPDAPAFHHTLYGRVALYLLTVGLVGALGSLLFTLFAG